MSLVDVLCRSYVVLSVGDCTPLNWEYQEGSNEGIYAPLYKVKGMPLLAKELPDVVQIEELLSLPLRGKEFEVIIDRPVEVGSTIMVHEVVNFGKYDVGTYEYIDSNENSDGQRQYKGVIMGQSETGGMQVYVLQHGEGIPEIWEISNGLKIGVLDMENPDGEEVYLGQVIRFLAKDSDIKEVEQDMYRKTLANIDVVKKYG